MKIIILSIRQLALAAVALLGLFLAGSGPVSAQTLYVSNNGNETIGQVTPGGVVSVFSGGSVGNCEGLAVDSAGDLYVANFDVPGFLTRFTPGGAASFINDSNLTGPVGLAFAAGNLYVVNNKGNFGSSVFRITPGGVVSSVFTYTLSNPYGIAFDPAGNFYVANAGNNTIVRTSANGLTSGVFANIGLNFPTGLACDAAGNLYVANSGSNTIDKFTPGGSGSVFANTGLNQPNGLAFDTAGNLYVANTGNNTIERFTPDGVGSVFANTGLNGPAFLAFGAVPEPSTWALALLGGAALLGVVRSGRRQID